MVKSAVVTAQRKGSKGLEFKVLDEAAGTFRAVFSTLNVIDSDGDVTLPGAFKEGQEVRIMQYGHAWHNLPVGKGVIHSDQEKAWVDGQFFLDTAAGTEHYRTIKNMGSLQEWSYGFNVEEAGEGDFNGSHVQFLRKLDVFEVSPVMLGAGVGTHTEEIKGQKKEPLTFDQAKSSLAAALAELKSDPDLHTVALEELRALIEEHTPKPPEPKSRISSAFAELAEARANSHALRRAG